MDNHPIPQDVTGFQFKLFGNMTVKQFALLAPCVVLAVILYYAPLVPLLIKFIFIPILPIIGVILAFVPIEGRPIDVMTRLFIKALYSPDQWIFHKQGGQLAIFAIQPAHAVVNTPNNHQAVQAREQQLQSYLQDIHTAPRSPLDEKESQFFQNLTTIQSTLPAVPVTPLTSSSQPPANNQHTASVALHSLSNNHGDHQASTSTPVIPEKQAATPPHIPPVNPSTLHFPKQVPVSQPPVPSPKPVGALPTQEQLGASAVSHPPAPEPPRKETAMQQATPPAQPLENQTVLSQQLTQVLSEKQRLEKELEQLKSHLARQQPLPTLPHDAASSPQLVIVPAAENKPAVQPVPAKIIPSAPRATHPSLVVPPPPPQTTPQPPKPLVQPAPEPATPATPHVRKVPKNLQTQVGAPTIPDTPNLIAGIVKDARGNVLQNILVEVKDKDGNPVRAFKTNALGQFASATPLTNGTYQIVLEDPKEVHKFDIIELTAKGEIILPLEVISYDAREELRRALFT